MIGIEREELDRLYRIEIAADDWTEWREGYGGVEVHPTEQALFDAVRGEK